MTKQDHNNDNGSPEPPERWKPDTSLPTKQKTQSATPNDPDVRVGIIASTHVELVGPEIAVFESARRLVTASQICAIVSFFIGGVLLSSVAVVCAITAFRKLNSIALGKPSEPAMQAALRKAGYLAIVLAAIALVINIVALIVLYPIAMDALQSGSLSSLFGGLSASGGSTGNSTWG